MAMHNIAIRNKKRALKVEGESATINTSVEVTVQCLTSPAFANHPAESTAVCRFYEALVCSFRDCQAVRLFVKYSQTYKQACCLTVYLPKG